MRSLLLLFWPIRSSPLVINCCRSKFCCTIGACWPFSMLLYAANLSALPHFSKTISILSSFLLLSNWRTVKSNTNTTCLSIPLLSNSAYWCTDVNIPNYSPIPGYATAIALIISLIDVLFVLIEIDGKNAIIYKR